MKSSWRSEAVNPIFLFTIQYPNSNFAKIPLRVAVLFFRGQFYLILRLFAAVLWIFNKFIIVIVW